ncbi:MAG TPA: hypothetical protein VIW24_12815 [Aldersonia sp.]
MLTALAVVVPAAADGAPTPSTDPLSAPERTAISYQGTAARFGTLNQFDSYPALSIAKLYIVDYAVRHGDGNPDDMALAERMIRVSDDVAADTLAARYPMAIDDIAAENNLTATHGADYWGNSVTSVADVVTFLQAKMAEFPLSPVLAWMIMAAPIAADGTVQDWGTATLPGAVGSKWAWSDFGASLVLSASFGADFAAAAVTYGEPADQSDDVRAAFAPGPTLALAPASRERDCDR